MNKCTTALIYTIVILAGTIYLIQCCNWSLWWMIPAFTLIPTECDGDDE